MRCSPAVIRRCRHTLLPQLLPWWAQNCHIVHFDYKRASVDAFAQHVTISKGSKAEGGHLLKVARCSLMGGGGHRVTGSNSHVTRHTSHVTRHTSHANLNLDARSSARILERATRQLPRLGAGLGRGGQPGAPPPLQLLMMRWRQQWQRRQQRRWQQLSLPLRRHDAQRCMR